MKRIIMAIRKELNFRRNEKELSRLTDTELADIGINRYDISDVVRGRI